MAPGWIRLISKGFGIISRPAGRGTVIFDQEDVVEGSFESLRQGQVVEYTRVKTPKGWRATHVRVVRTPPEGS
ncbi:MAG: cold-shock protein [Candidatus Methylomirabilia bacterium]